jgi:hypothetical protein
MGIAILEKLKLILLEIKLMYMAQDIILLIIKQKD